MRKFHILAINTIIFCVYSLEIDFEWQIGTCYIFYQNKDNKHFTYRRKYQIY